MTERAGEGKTGSDGWMVLVFQRRECSHYEVSSRDGCYCSLMTKVTWEAGRGPRSCGHRRDLTQCN